MQSNGFGDDLVKAEISIYGIFDIQVVENSIT